MSDYSTMLAEIGQVLAGVDEGEVRQAVERIAVARHVMVAGCGREGLQLKGLAMRLHHLGLKASVQGDMAAPPLGPGDLLVASAGPGEVSTVTALMRVAREAGAEVLFLTAVPDTPSAKLASAVLTLPAQTMANDMTGSASRVLPMGSAFEGAMFFLFEGLILRLQARLGVSPEAMRANHTNME